MRKLLALALLAFAGPAFAGPVPPRGCPHCGRNQAALQAGAQFHVSSGSVDGQLTVGTLAMSTVTASTVTASAAFVGPGALVTNLNASALASGTVAAARVGGAYTGITGVGTLSVGAWNASLIEPQYGGMGQNFVAVSSGSIPYFSGVGVMSTLGPQTQNMILQTNGAGQAPSWTSAPTIMGTHISTIPLSALWQTGTLPPGIVVSTNSIPLVNGAAVSGNISGLAANISGTLPLAQLGSGVLGANIKAQALVASGVSSGTYGGYGVFASVTVSTMGLVTSATQYTSVFASTSVALINVQNSWSAPQTFPQVTATTGTFTGLFASTVTATLFNGALNGAASNVAAAGVGNGALNVGVKVSTANISPGFNGASELLQMTAAGKLPAVDGSALLSLPTSNKIVFLSGNNMTLGVGTFQTGYVNQSVVISSITVVITSPGSGGSTGTTWGCCYGGTCTLVNSAAGAAAGSALSGGGVVIIPPGGQLTLQMVSTDESVTPSANVTCSLQ